MSLFKTEKIILYLVTFLPIGIMVGSSVSTSMIILIGLLFLFYSYRYNDWKWLNQKFIKLLIILYIYLIINLIFSQDLLNSAPRNLGFIRYILLIAAINFFLNKDENKKILIRYWTIIIIIFGIDIYFEFIFHQNLLGFKSVMQDRIVSFFKDEQVAGGFLSSFFLLIISFFIVDNNFFPKKIFKLRLIIPIFLLIAIFLTGERANTIRAVLSLVIFYFFIKNISLKKKFLSASIIIVLLFSISNFSDKTSHLKSRYTYIYKIQSLVTESIYIKHYYAGYQIFKSYPYMGVGNKNFGSVCFRKASKGLLSIWDNSALTKAKFWSRGVCSTHPHQIYFELLSEHGIIGTLIILAIIFSILFNNFKYFLINKNYIHLALITSLAITFLPMLPTGSFGGNFSSTLFWLNFSLMILFSNQRGGHDKN